MGSGTCTACGHRIWKVTKQQPRTAGPGNMLGCCLFSFHFLWAILCTSTVLSDLQCFQKCLSIMNLYLGMMASHGPGSASMLHLSGQRVRLIPSTENAPSSGSLLTTTVLPFMEVKEDSPETEPSMLCDDGATCRVARKLCNTV